MNAVLLRRLTSLGSAALFWGLSPCGLGFPSITTRPMCLSSQTWHLFPDGPQEGSARPLLAKLLGQMTNGIRHRTSWLNPS